ncbi:MAG: MraY family glycosyltransferase [Gammaproteobacteria bacterium]
MTGGVAIPAIAVAGVAALLALLAVPVLARFAPGWDLLDYPGKRKFHGRTVPLVGGLAIAFAAFAALGVGALWGGYLNGFSWWFVLGAAVILTAGVLDDLFDLRHWRKASFQIAAILLLVFLAGARITTLGALVGGAPIQLGYAAIPFTIICLLGYVNAVNMVDGLDGLAGGVSVIALAFLAACAWVEGLSGLFLVVVAFGVATLAFLIYNLRTPWRRKAAVFLGDAGSMTLGLVVGWAAVRIAGESSHGIVAPISLAWVLALPVMDTLVVMGRRLALRRNPFSPDRLHLHHVLVDLGYSPGQATAVLLTLAFFYGAYGLAGAVAGLPQWVLFASFLGVLAAHALFVSLVHRHAVSASMPPAHSDSVMP